MSLRTHGFPQLPTSSFEKKKTIHDTAACEVFIARRKVSDGAAAEEAGEQLIVVRRTKIVGPNSLDSFDLQSELFALCHHPNIVRPIALCMDPPTYAQLLPLAAYGSLHELLHDPARDAQRCALSWPLCLALARDVAAAIDYLHSELGLLFRDLKPANVLVFGDLSARLTDFDTVRYADDKRNRTKTVYHHGPSGGFHKALIAGTLVCAVVLSWIRRGLRLYSVIDSCRRRCCRCGCCCGALVRVVPCR
jgi:serine/threonine protein kinase